MIPPRRPPVTVSPESVRILGPAVSPASFANTLSSTVCRTIVLSAPAPVIIRLPTATRSVPSLAASTIPGWSTCSRSSAYVPAGSTIVSASGAAFACWTSARSVHLPLAAAQTPSARFASTPSAVEFTVKTVVARVPPSVAPRISPAASAARITASLPTRPNVSAFQLIAERDGVASARRCSRPRPRQPAVAVDAGELQDELREAG